MTESHLAATVAGLRHKPVHKRRILMTAGCRDADGIPKVPDAGRVFRKGFRRYQLMHNGVRVVADGYDGSWMTEIIRLLKGHHEPQEERVFHEVLPHIPPGGIMLELGSYWAYYSLWFNRSVPGARNYMIEPDPKNLALGRKNFALNGARGEFFQYAIGSRSGPPIPFKCRGGRVRPIELICVDDFIAAEKIPRIDLLLSDIQGFELGMLQGAERAIGERKIRFAVVSTHHPSISGDAEIHAQCLAFIAGHGGHVLASHTVGESFSGDGLIAASFWPEDRNLPAIPLSRNDPAASARAMGWEPVEGAGGGRPGSTSP